MAHLCFQLPPLTLPPFLFDQPHFCKARLIHCFLCLVPQPNHIKFHQHLLCGKLPTWGSQHMCTLPFIRSIFLIVFIHQLNNVNFFQKACTCKRFVKFRVTRSRSLHLYLQPKSPSPFFLIFFGHLIPSFKNLYAISCSTTRYNKKDTRKYIIA